MAKTVGERSKELLQKGFFKNLKEAKARVGSDWLSEGHYWCMIQRVKIDENRTNQAAFFIEMVTLKILDDADGKGHRRPGIDVTHAIWQRFDSFLGNVKQFLTVVLDEDPNDIDMEHVEMVIEDDQPLSGTVVEVKGTQILTKAGKPFTRIDYVREVPAVELAEGLDAETIERYFPGDRLQKLIELEAA